MWEQNIIFNKLKFLVLGWLLERICNPGHMTSLELLLLPSPLRMIWRSPYNSICYLSSELLMEFVHLRLPFFMTITLILALLVLFVLLVLLLSYLHLSAVCILAFQHYISHALPSENSPNFLIDCLYLLSPRSCPFGYQTWQKRLAFGFNCLLSFLVLFLFQVICCVPQLCTNIISVSCGISFWGWHSRGQILLLG